ncbi:MAG: hypothetical protein QG672_768 [Pseudomonadota bacterium]|nr:hypothetical protein [Pseudomonadota bacterium]
MNLPTMAIWVAGILSIGFFCSTVGEEEDGKPPPQIKTSMKVYRAPPEDLSTKRLYVEFADSPRLSEAFRATLGSRGFNMATSAEESEVQIRFIGSVAIGLFATKPKMLPLAEAVEKSAIRPIGKDEAEVNNRSLVGVVAMDAAAKQLTPSFRSTLSATNLMEWIGDVTGLRGAFNKAITGDPRGFCMSEHCSKYQQNVVVGATGGASWLITLSALSEEILLDRLIKESLSRALKPLVSR